MTFRAERYPADWKAIRARILARAENRCERCRAPNRTMIARADPHGCHAGTYMLWDGGAVHDAETGAYLGLARGGDYDAGSHCEVVLTIAHLDHVESHNDDSNLKALCQRCHLNHDRADNARRARENRAARVGQCGLFDGSQS